MKCKHLNSGGIKTVMTDLFKKYNNNNNNRLIKSQKFTYVLQNLYDFNYLIKIRGIIQKAHYCLFSTDLNKISHRPKLCLNSHNRK